MIVPGHYSPLYYNTAISAPPREERLLGDYIHKGFHSFWVLLLEIRIRIVFWFRNILPTARSYDGLMRSLAFLAYLPWLAQATHAVMASSPGSGADCDNTSVSYPVGVSELTFDTDSVINHYATNATKPPAAKHCTFDALCGISERFLDDSFQAGRHAFTGGVEPTNFHSTLSCDLSLFPR